MREPKHVARDAPVVVREDDEERERGAARDRGVHEHVHVQPPLGDPTRLPLRRALGTEGDDQADADDDDGERNRRQLADRLVVEPVAKEQVGEQADRAGGLHHRLRREAQRQRVAALRANE